MLLRVHYAHWTFQSINWWCLDLGYYCDCCYQRHVSNLRPRFECLKCIVGQILASVLEATMSQLVVILFVHSKHIRSTPFIYLAIYFFTNWFKGKYGLLCSCIIFELHILSEQLLWDVWWFSLYWKLDFSLLAPYWYFRDFSMFLLLLFSNHTLALQWGQFFDDTQSSRLL